MSGRRLVVQPRAEIESTKAALWYKAQRPGLGGEFLDAVREALATIRERPNSFPLQYKETRRAGLRRFPYSVFFVVDDDRSR